MAAGLGFKTFTTGEVLTAADTNGYLMQGILVFASAAARDAAITSPQEGQFAYLKDTNVTTYYTGSAWANVDTTGMTNPMTTTGDLIYSSPGSTPVRLGIGTANQILRVNSGASAPEWATPAAAASGLTFISRTTFSASAAVTVDSLFSDTYENYLVRIQATGSAAANLQIQFRYGSTTHTTANYDYAWGGVDATANTFRFIRNYGQSQILLDVMNTSYRSLYDLNICRLNGTDRIGLTGTTWGQENIQGMAGGAFTAAQQAWSGMYLTPSTGTMTGQVTVYGMAKS